MTLTLAIISDVTLFLLAAVGGIIAASLVIFSRHRHPTIRLLLEHAKNNLASRQYSSAWLVYCAAMAIRRQPESVQSAIKLRQYARRCIDRPNISETVDVFYTVINEILKKSQDSDCSAICDSMREAAAIHVVNKQHDRAEQWARRAVNKFELEMGGSHPGMVVYLNVLATILIDEGKDSVAGPLFERAMKIMDAMPHLDPINHAITYKNYAELCIKRGDYLQAEHFSQAALKFLDTIPKNVEQEQRLSCLDLLAKSLKCQGFHSQANEVFNQLEKMLPIPPRESIWEINLFSLPWIGIPVSLLLIYFGVKHFINLILRIAIDPTVPGKFNIIILCMFNMGLLLGGVYVVMMSIINTNDQSFINTIRRCLGATLIILMFTVGILIAIREISTMP